MCEQSDSTGHAALFTAVRDGRISLAILPRNAPITDEVLNRSSRPKLVLLGDDDGHSTGPAGFRAWQKLRPWANCGLVHAAAADVDTYHFAVAATMLGGRTLLIETDSAYAHEWAEALYQANIPSMTVVPRGGVHPVMPPPDRTSNGGGRGSS
jgi:hypothetical protein